jgi:hypothetical protein
MNDATLKHPSQAGRILGSLISNGGPRGFAPVFGHP